MADRIIVVGSLNPEKEVQDRVRVLSGGYLPSNKGNRLQRSSESACGIYDPYNKSIVQNDMSYPIGERLQTFEICN